MKSAALFLLLWAAAVQAQAPFEDPRRRAYDEWRAGYALHMAGKYAAAAERYRASLAAHPTAEAHTFLGWSISQLGRMDEAIAHCKAAIELDPDYGNPYNDIGVYLMALGRADEAPPWFEGAIGARRYCCRHYPLTNLGRLLARKGRIEEARRLLERALELVPDYAPALEGLELIGGKRAS